MRPDFAKQQRQADQLAIELARAKRELAQLKKEVDEQRRLWRATGVSKREKVDTSDLDAASAFLKILRLSFNEGELHDLTDAVGVPWAALGGDSTHEKARELVDYCRRYGIYLRLAIEAERRRPNQNWPPIDN